LHAAALMRPRSRALSWNSANKAELRLVMPRQSVKLIEIDFARKK
jgi:hypothetical protein